MRNQDAALVGDVMVVPYTCVEDENAWRNPDMQNIVVGLRGLNVENGDELWRTEENWNDVFVEESTERELELVNDDYLMVHDWLERTTALLDVRTGEFVPEKETVFAGPEGTDWLVEANGGNEYVRLGEGLSEEARVDFSFESDWNQIVPLGDGLATVADVESDPKAVFQAWDEESERVYVDLGIAGDEVLDMASVPGAVVVLYRSTETGDLGVIGLT